MNGNKLNNLKENVAALVEETLGPVLKPLSDALGTIEADVKAAATKTKPALQNLANDAKTSAIKIKSQFDESMRLLGEAEVKNQQILDEGRRELAQEEAAAKDANRFTAALTSLVGELNYDKVVVGWLAPELVKFAKNINNLCSELQSYIGRCGCSGGSAAGGSYSSFLESLQNDFIGAGSLSDTASGVHVQVHNYGPQQEGSHRSKSGRGLQQMVSDSVAKDMKRGGAGAIAIKQAFGVARQPIQR